MSIFTKTVFLDAPLNIASRRTPVPRFEEYEMESGDLHSVRTARNKRFDFKLVWSGRLQADVDSLRDLWGTILTDPMEYTYPVDKDIYIVQFQAAPQFLPASFHPTKGTLWTIKVHVRGVKE